MDSVAFPALQPGESAENAGWALLRSESGLTVIAPDGTAVELALTEPPAAGHGRRILVLGGARSGKSAYAESLIADCPVVTYVATAFARPDDAEWVARVAAHRERRSAGWRTVESIDLAGLLPRADGPLLIDCISLWLGAQLEAPDLPRLVEALVQAWADCPVLVVAVSSEVGSGVVPVSAAGRRYRDELGRLNARLAATADEVWLVTAGLPRRLR
jgi:adenosylcobinamide kinase/adenosylcobinamide-phosphate guanylyltransferase